MPNTITIDPVTKVEGHLKVKVELDSSNKVTTAYMTGNLFRDMENILKDRHPWDAIHITQRICGVCPVSHAIASVKANEQAMGFTPSSQATLQRTIIQAGNYLQDHILHFYHLSLMDYIIGPQLNPWSPGYDVDMRINSTDTQRLITNYLEGLKVRRQAQEMVAILAGRVPHVMSIAPGGVTMPLEAGLITQMKSYLVTVKDFINNKYLPDVETLTSAYSDYFAIGQGPPGQFPQLWDIIILDVMMPSIDGVKVCEEIRKSSTVPIIMLTAKNEEADRILGLETGADDYMGKPFSPRELVARIKAASRRASTGSAPDQHILTFTGMRIDLLNRDVFVLDEQIYLTPKEFDLLSILARSPKRIYSREQLLSVWGIDYYGDVRIVDTNINRLRDKLRVPGAPSFVSTVWGRGYKFEVIETE
ncbi:hypothetical protein JCM17380_46830 [Desulfosporosinus burensis]